MSAKEELRHTLKEARLAMSPDEVASKSAAIVEQLKQLVDRPDFLVVHCFEPIEKRNEVNVTPLVGFLQARQPEPELFTSKAVNDWWQVVSLDGQPVYRQPVFDCIILPMIGFDEDSLHRLGNGGGYYDRFLSKQPQACKIGICYESGKFTDFPAEPHDIALDIVVTEQHVYRRS